MKKKLCLLVAAALLVSGCGEIPKLENGQDAVVTFENGDKISVDDLYEKVKDTYALSSLMQMIDKYVIETTFEDAKTEAETSADNYVKALSENFGGDAKLLEQLNASGIASIQAYKDMMYINFLQSYAAEEYAKEQITDKEIEKYYEDEIVGDIEVSHILITPNVTDDMKDEDVKKAEEKAKAQIEEIIKTLKETKTSDVANKFKELAKEKSMDDATKEKGGELGKINKDTLSADYDELVDAAYKLKDGEYSTSVITTELGYHVILRTKSHEKASLKDSKEKILDTLANELLNKDATIVVNSLTHYRKELGMDIQDSELQTQYSYYVQNQLANATNANANQSEGK